jgi:phosphoglycerate dehydrogenase-like enzyme
MKVFVGQPLVEPSTTDLLAGHTVVTGAGNLPRSEWPLLADADALLPTPRERVTAEILAAAPRVRIVASHSVGVDHVEASRPRKAQIRSRTWESGRMPSLNFVPGAARVA